MAESLDSFDDRVTADLGAKYSNYTLVGSQLTAAITSAGGRNGTNGLRLTRASSAQTVSASFVQAMPAAARYKMAFARRWSTLPPSGQYRVIAAMRDTGTTQCELRLYSDGSIRLYRSGSLVIGGQSAGGLVVATAYNHFEWDLVVNNTTGSSELRINETTIAFTVTNQNTRATALNQINELEFKLVPSDTSGDTSFTDDSDDWVWHDQSAFKGDMKVGVYAVTGNGTYTDWTANGAGTLADCVDDTAQDGDSTYTSSSTIGQKETFAVADVPVTATIVFAQNVWVVKKTDAGTRTFAARTKSGSSEQLGSSFAPTSGYTFIKDAINLDPATGVTWTAAGFNAAEFGEEVTA